MLRLIVRIVQVQLLCLCILLVYNGIARPENAVFWYALTTLTMLVLTITYKIARRQH